jgi:hypothetical protein
MPRKEFEAFTRLDASDVNSFLMDQSVMTFGSATARDAAIDTPVEGQVTYLTDIDSLSVYNGTQWVTNRPVMNFAGTAARGSAIPTPVEGMAAYLNDSDILSLYDGSAWKTSVSTTGGILQVVTANSNTEVSSTSGSAVSTGLTATITPKSTSSRIAIFVDLPAQNSTTTSASAYTIFRGTIAGTNLGTTGSSLPGFAGLYNSAGAVRAPISMHYIDSPNTTSATQYTAAFFPQSGGAIVMHEGRRGSITLMEIAG